MVAALGGNSLELVVGEITEGAARGSEGVVELVVGIVHLIYTEHRFQTTFVKGFIMSDER